MSRSYSADLDGERVCLMVPLHDMANHGTAPNVSFSCARDGYATATRLMTCLFTCIALFLPEKATVRSMYYSTQQM